MSPAAGQCHWVAVQDGVYTWHPLDLVHPIPTARPHTKRVLTKAALCYASSVLVVMCVQSAISGSSFDDVLFLDSDSVPALDPAFLFHTPQYTHTGKRPCSSHGLILP